MTGQQAAPHPPGAAAPQAAQHAPAQQQQPAPRQQATKLLDYIVAIDDAQAVMDRLRHARRGEHDSSEGSLCGCALACVRHHAAHAPPAWHRHACPTLTAPPRAPAGAPLHLPAESGCLRVWEVLAGRVQQRRVWTFGRRAPESSDPSAATTAAAVSSAEPLSIRDGVVFTSCAAGRAHGAAADAGGHVFTWGANDLGQCGVAADAAPVIAHTLQDGAAEGAAADAGGSSAAGGQRRMTKLDSLALLERSVRLPPSLLQSLKAAQAQERARRAAEAANAAAAAEAAAEAPGGAQAAEAAAKGEAAAAAAAAGSQLRVYRVTIGQAVSMVACGGVSGGGIGRSAAAGRRSRRRRRCVHGGVQTARSCRMAPAADSSLRTAAPPPPRPTRWPA